jgi:hypothetical protein
MSSVPGSGRSSGWPIVDCVVVPSVASVVVRLGDLAVRDVAGVQRLTLKRHRISSRREPELHAWPRLFRTCRKRIAGP